MKYPYIFIQNGEQIIDAKMQINGKRQQKKQRS